jgi:hypothetical protein
MAAAQQAAVRDGLAATNPNVFIPSFQDRNALADAACRAVLPLLDLHHVERRTVCVFCFS